MDEPDASGKRRSSSSVLNKACSFGFNQTQEDEKVKVKANQKRLSTDEGRLIDLKDLPADAEYALKAA